MRFVLNLMLALAAITAFQAKAQTKIGGIYIYSPEETVRLVEKLGSLQNIWEYLHSERVPFFVTFLQRNDGCSEYMWQAQRLIPLAFNPTPDGEAPTRRVVLLNVLVEDAKPGMGVSHALNASSVFEWDHYDPGLFGDIPIPHTVYQDYRHLDPISPLQHLGTNSDWRKFEEQVLRDFYFERLRKLGFDQGQIAKQRASHPSKDQYEGSEFHQTLVTRLKERRGYTADCIDRLIDRLELRQERVDILGERIRRGLPLGDWPEADELRRRYRETHGHAYPLD